MNTRWKRLAGDLLESAAREFSNHGCNDWKWPKGWTIGERQVFLQSIRHWAADLSIPLDQVYGEYAPVGDSTVMYFLADELRIVR